MKKKIRVRLRVSKVRVLRNEKTLPQRKMYTPRVKLCGCTWVFTIGDPDDKPSVPHAHAVDSGYRLDAWSGDIYPAGTERMQKIGKLKQKDLRRLHSDPKFLAHAKKQIDWYREKYPANHDRILYYSNPAGYIAEKEAVVDTMFQTQELERFLQKQSLTIRWEDGVYDRLLLGQRGGRFDPEAPPLKSCRVWQLTRDSPINMRFIPYEVLLERFGQPDRKHYETVYDGLVGTNDPEEIYTFFRDPVPGYDGRPIGISDVLELYDEGGSEFYYCDRIGFQQIEFAPQQEMDMSL